jgi:hypothetical protein
MDLGDDSMAQDPDETATPEDFTELLASVPDSPTKEADSPVQEPRAAQTFKLHPNAKSKEDKLFFSEGSDSSDSDSGASASLERIRQAAAREKKADSRPTTARSRSPTPITTKQTGKAGGTKQTKSTRTAVKATSRKILESTSIFSQPVKRPTTTTAAAVPQMTRGKRQLEHIDLSDSDEEESSPPVRAPVKSNPQSSQSAKAISKSASATKVAASLRALSKQPIEVIDLLSD